MALLGSAEPTEAPAALLWLRAFGSRDGDLDVDLSMSGPEPVTDVLVRCGRSGTVSATREAIEDLTVGTRTRALLMLAVASGRESVQVLHQCTACAERMEVDVPFREIARFGADTAHQVRVVDAGRQWLVRLPSGMDQRRWASAGISDPLAMARSLVVEGDGADLDEGWLDRLGSTLQGVDPLIDFRLHVRCPGCTAAHSLDLDLQALALEELRRIQRALMVAVHRLASAYHWSEADIVAMPAWRRETYVAWVQPDEVWS